MHKLFRSCLAWALLAGAGAAQSPAAPEPAPAVPATPVTPELPKAPPGEVGQLLEYGSFELPRVRARTPKLKGGNILLFYSDEWMTFQGEPDTKDGTLVVGLTNEVARTGRQSIYVEFNKCKKQKAEAILASQLVPVRAGASYRVGIWGRMDKQKPLTLDQPLPLLRLQVDFFEADSETQTGDQVFRVQPMPGSKDRPPFFITKSWREYYASFEVPEGAAFLKMTWSWHAPAEMGEISGTMFFDDATVTGERVTPAEEPPEPDPNAPVGTPAPAPAPEVPAPAAAIPAVKVIPATPAPVRKIPPPLGTRR